jgi:MFS family permease
MSKSQKSMFSFLKTLPINLKLMIARNSIINFVNNVNPYGSIYILALGATGVQLGTLNSMSQALSAVFAILTGWIGDRSERKRIYLIGSAVGLCIPLIYYFSMSWMWLIPAFIVGGIADGIVQPAWTAMYANNVKSKNRGAVYGIINVFTLAPLLFAGLIGGTIVSIFGGLNPAGIRPLYLVQITLVITAWIIIWRYLIPEKPGRKMVPFTIKNAVKDYREIWKNKGARNWVLMKSLGSVSIGLAGPFWMVYAATVHNASAMTIAYMVTIRSITQIVLSPYTGRLVDQVGRRKMIIIGRTIMYVGTVIFLLWGKEFLVLLFAWILMGINDATGIAWSAQEAELVTRYQRSRMSALSHGAFNLLAIPASLLGGFLWDYVNKLAPFIVMVLIDGLIRMPVIYLYVPEGDKDEDEGADPDSGVSLD